MAINVAPTFPVNAQIIEFPSPALPAEQYRAIELILLGNSMTQVSSKLGIDRKTLFLWRKGPVFIAELNRRRLEALEASDQRLRRLSEKAVSVIEKHLDEGSLQAATVLLKLVQGLPQPDKEIDPQRLLKHQAEEYAVQFWNESPFAEDEFSPMTYANPNFKALARYYYEALTLRYKLDPGDAEELCEEIISREASRCVGRERLAKILASGKANNENQKGGMSK